MNQESLETAQRLEAILESAVDGILSIDEKGMITSLNQAAVNIFGYEREELIGTTVNRLMRTRAASKRSTPLSRTTAASSSCNPSISIGRGSDAIVTSTASAPSRPIATPPAQPTFLPFLVLGKVRPT